MSESNTTKPAQDEQKDIVSLTMLQLLSLLKPVQIWAILVVIFAVLSGTFGLGYKLGGLIAESEVVRYETESATLKDQIKQIRAIQAKEKFLALYLRYLIAKDAYSVDESEENQEAIDVAIVNFKSYIDELLARGDEVSEEIDLWGLFLGKSGGRDVTVKFGYDGSVWPLPPEFGFYAEEVDR